MGVGEDTEHNVRRPIKPTLDVCIYDFSIKTATAKISNCNPTLVLLFHQYVLWFQIAVDNTEVFKVAQSREKLNSEASNQTVLESLVVVHLYEFIQVNGVQIKHNAQVITPDEVVLQLDNTLDGIRIAFLEKKE